MTAPAVQHAIDAAFGEERGRVVATLIRRTGDWDMAEECAQQAFTRRCGDGQERHAPPVATHIGYRVPCGLEM